MSSGLMNHLAHRQTLPTGISQVHIAYELTITISYSGTSVSGIIAVINIFKKKQQRIAIIYFNSLAVLADGHTPTYNYLVWFVWSMVYNSSYTMTCKPIKTQEF